MAKDLKKFKKNHTGKNCMLNTATKMREQMELPGKI